MNTAAESIREHRTQAGLSQSQLAERLCVSRQAVSKWESGAGLPDIENLKAMAALFSISVDDIVTAGERATNDNAAVLRTPIDLSSYEPYKIAGKPFGSRAHAAVKAAYPKATIRRLARKHVTTRSETRFETLLAFVFDAPFGIFGAKDGVSDMGDYYLVESGARQLIVRVGKHEVESRKLTTPVTGSKFQVGQDAFKVLEPAF